MTCQYSLFSFLEFSILQCASYNFLARSAAARSASRSYEYQKFIALISIALGSVLLECSGTIQRFIFSKKYVIFSNKYGIGLPGSRSLTVVSDLLVEFFLMLALMGISSYGVIHMHAYICVCIYMHV